jgi:HEAT repeat protein
MQRIKVLGSLFLGALTLAAALPIGHAQVTTFLGKNAETWAAQLGPSSDAPARRNAAFALGKIGSAASGYLPELLKLFQNDPDPTVKEAAAFAIGQICKASKGTPPGDPAQYVTALATALTNDANPLVQRSASYALGCLGPKAKTALKALDQAVTDSRFTPVVKQNALWALGEIGGSEAVLTLTKALNVPEADPLVVRDAAFALAKLAPEATKSEGRINIVTALLKHLNRPDLATKKEVYTEVKKALLQALVPIVVPADAALVVGPLQGLINGKDDKLNFENDEVRFNAALALSKLGGTHASGAVAFLTEKLETGDLNLRRQVAAIIGNIGKPALVAVPALKKALKDADTVVRKHAAVSLGGIGAPMNPALPVNKNKPLDPDRPQIAAVVPDLIAVLGNPKEDPAVRVAAAVALKEIGPCAELNSPTATEVLISTVANPNNPPELRARTLWPLRFHANVANLSKLFDALNQILDTGAVNTKTKDLRYDAAYLLSKYKKKDVSDKVLDTLLEFLKDPGINIAKNTEGIAKPINENKDDKSDTKIVKGGDGRIIALQAINFIVNEEFGGDSKKVINRPDIMAQLKILAGDAKIDPDVQKYAQVVVKYLAPTP